MKMKNERGTPERIRTAVAAAALLSVLVPSQASDFPSKPVTFVVSFSAGGPVDALTRALGQRLSQEWKQQVLIDNRPGASESLAAQAVARAAPDGYTLLASSEGPLTMNQHLFKRLPYHPEKDFAPVTQLVQVPMALVTPVGFPAGSLKEFLDLARSRSAARPLNYGSTGVGGITHLPMAMLATKAQLTLNHIPYKGAAPLLPELVAGQVDATFLAVQPVAPFVKEKKLKALAVSSPVRLKVLPDVPTFKELGVADPQATFIMGLAAPAGTPAVVLERIAKSVQKITWLEMRL